MSTTSTDSDRHPWKRAILNIREELTEITNGLRNEYPPVRTILLPDEHHVMTSLLLSYYKLLRIKRDENDRIRDLWEAEIDSFHIPSDDQTIRVENPTILREQNPDRTVLANLAGSLEYEMKEVTLGSLQEDWFTDNSVTINMHGWVENQGPKTRSIRTRYHLPMAGVDAVINQLDDCYEKFGWTPEISSTPRTEITEELMRDVNEKIKEIKQQTNP